MSILKTLCANIQALVHSKFSYKDDYVQFGVLERWDCYADEVEAGETFEDDCDGFALTCAVLLIRNGAPTGKVRIAACIEELGGFHLVCVCDGWVLDNRRALIKKWDEIDYTWLYSMGMNEPNVWRWADGSGGYIPAVSDDPLYELYFNPGGPYIEWSRAKDGDVFKSGIDIFYKHPTNGLIEVYPYWQSTALQYRNPDDLNPHGNIRTQMKGSIEKGSIHEDEKWNKNLPVTDEYRKIDPLIQPGEYLVLKQTVNINGFSFSKQYECRYESPLFTGGILLSKEEDTEDQRNTTYTVKIFGNIVSGIKPTDFFSEYTIGKWVYLLKKGTSLSEGKQDYSSSSIQEPGLGESYILTPYNFSKLWGPDCAIQYEKAIGIDTWEEMFDMIQIETPLLSIDYENDTAEVDIPGASVHSLPVFYYCEATDSIVGGSSAFSVGDTVLVCKKENTLTDAKIVGFPDQPKNCQTHILMRSRVVVVASSYNGFISTFEFDPLNPPPSNYDRDKKVLSLSPKINYFSDNSVRPFGFYSFNNENRVEDLPSYPHPQTSHEYLVENCNYLDREDVEITGYTSEKSVASWELPTFIEWFPYTWFKGTEDEYDSIVPVEMTTFGIEILSSGFFSKNYNLNYTGISVSDTELSIEYTDSGSADHGLYTNTPTSSKLFFSNALTGEPDYTFNVTLLLNDYPESLQYRGKNFIREKFKHFAQDSPNYVKDVYVQYIREDLIEEE